jgi:cytochrome c553
MAQDHPPIEFARHIQPILDTYCVRCHANGVAKGNFSIESRERMLASKGVVVPGDAEASRLIHLVRGDDPLAVMPAEGERLSDADIALLAMWIDQGAAWEKGVSVRRDSAPASIKPRRPTLPPPSPEVTHPIDRIIARHAAERGATLAPVIADPAFIRRVSLDLVGLLPTPDAVQAFIRDADPAKRASFVRRLLEDDRAVADHWISFWNDLLCNDYAGTGYIDGGRTQITAWLHEALASNLPYDRFVAELVNPSSSESAGFANGITWRGEVSASQITALQYARNVSQVFLGVNMKCASCHDSFIDRWTLADAYGLAAIVAEGPLEMSRCDIPTGEFARARFLFPEIGDVDPNAPTPERMRQFARLMTHAENGRLARTIVNRLWSRLMGRGIVEPVDEMANEPWCADLLDFLAVDLVDHGYDLRHAMFTIATSLAYQRETAAADESGRRSNGFVFRGPSPQRMTAEQFVDALWSFSGGGPSSVEAPIASMPLRGRWIWSFAAASRDLPKPGEAIDIRAALELTAAAARARVVVTCDNQYALWVNEIAFGGDAEWWTVETIDITHALRHGANEIRIEARNLGDAPNPAALFLEGIVELEGGAIVEVASDATWEWRPTHSQAAVGVHRAHWQPAHDVVEQGFLGPEVNSMIASSVAALRADPAAFARASLANADALMRSLGRPNREHVVTTRPADLSTLQALDFTNGGMMHAQMEQGAHRLLDECAGDGDRIVDRAFALLLSRPPSASERTLVLEFLGSSPTTEAVADAMWAMFMLPEFQMVR